VGVTAPSYNGFRFPVEISLSRSKIRFVGLTWGFYGC
jgi:hypothetical protein